MSTSDGARARRATARHLAEMKQWGGEIVLPAAYDPFSAPRHGANALHFERIRTASP